MSARAHVLAAFGVDRPLLDLCEPEQDLAKGCCHFIRQYVVQRTTTTPKPSQIVCLQGCSQRLTESLQPYHLCLSRNLWMKSLPFQLMMYLIFNL